jgi:hypothetical protein
MISNALSGTTTGAFDELFVRDPSLTGAFRNVLNLGGGGGSSYDDAALRSSITSNSSAISALSSTTTSALATKRSTADSYGVSEVDGFLATKASTAELNSAITALSDTTTTRLTGKLDKEAAYTSTQVDQLLLTAADATASALSTKRNEAQSYTITQVDALIAGSRPISAVDGLQTELDAKASLTQLNTEITTLGDSVTSRLTGKLDKSAAYTSTEVDQLLLTAADATTAALSTKRDEAQSYTITQVDALVATSRPISGVGGLQTSLDAKASLTQLNTEITTLGDSVTTRLTGKRDKSSSYSSTQVDQLLSDAADTTNATLSTKRDESESYTITQIDSMVSGLQAASYSSSEVDALLDTKHPTIRNNGSLDIAAIGGLGNVLSSFQPLITSGHLSFAMTSGLQLALNTLATDVAAIPTTQVILSNGTFVDQHRFGIENGEVVLDLNLGWLFRATPLWSQVLRDANRIRHARMGHLPLEPSSDCLCYFPLSVGKSDMGPSGLHLVKETDDDQGTWGVYTHISPTASDGLPLTEHTRLFPNRTIPDTQVSSKQIGWDATQSWLFETQVWLPSGSTLQLVATADADVDINAPDLFYILTLYATGDMKFRWDNRLGESGNSTVANIVIPERWHHIAMQKNADDNNLRIYCGGLLILTVDIPYPLSNFDEIKFGPVGGIPRIREFSVRTLAVYPITPFTPGPVTFAATLGDTQSRWNSYMII